jgi:hypothetical protein
MMAGQADAADVVAAWTHANLGVDPVLIAQAVAEAEITRTRMAAEDQLNREPSILVQGSPVWSLAALSDGRLASGGDNGEVKLWPKDGKGEPIVLRHGVLTDAGARAA